MEIIDWLNQNDGFFLVVLTTAYVIATIVTVRKMAKSNKIAQKNIEVFKELEKERNRPSLVFTIEPVKTVLVEAKVRNVGISTAHNISIETDPEISNLKKGREVKFLSEDIPSLAPGAELSTIMGSFNEFLEKIDNKSVSGFIKYQRLDGKEYKEDFNIDLSVYKGLASIREKGIDDIAKELEKIRKQIRHLITGFKKPLIRTIDEEDYQEKQKERRLTEEEMIRQNQKVANELKGHEEE